MSSVWWWWGQIDLHTFPIVSISSSPVKFLQNLILFSHTCPIRVWDDVLIPSLGTGELVLWVGVGWGNGSIGICHLMLSKVMVVTWGKVFHVGVVWRISVPLMMGCCSGVLVIRVSHCWRATLNSGNPVVKVSNGCVPGEAGGGWGNTAVMLVQHGGGANLSLTMSTWSSINPTISGNVGRRSVSHGGVMWGPWGTTCAWGDGLLINGVHFGVR